MGVEPSDSPARALHDVRDARADDAAFTNQTRGRSEDRLVRQFLLFALRRHRFLSDLGHAAVDE